jgi:O-antigen/teichoic acid export membrane protein
VTAADIFRRLRQSLQSHWNMPLYRNTYLLAGNLLVSFFSGALFWILASRLFAPAEIGTANAFLAPAIFLSTLLLMGANHGLLRFSGEIEKSPTLLYSLLWVTVLLSAAGSIIGALAFLLPGFVHQVFGNLFASVGLYVVIIVSSTIWTVCEAAFVSLRAPVKLFFRNLVFGVARLALLFPLASFGQGGLLLAYSGGILLAALLSLDLVRRETKTLLVDFFTLQHPFLGKALSFALPNHLANILGSIPGMVLPLIAFNLLGAETNGYFSLAWTMAMIARTVLFAASSTLLSEGARDARLLRENRFRTLGFLLGAVGLTILPMLVFPRWLLSILGTRYVAANHLALPLLALSILPNVLSTIFIANERLHLRNGSVILFCLVTGILSSALPWLGAVYYGYNGFIIAYLLSQVLLGLLALPFLFR